VNTEQAKFDHQEKSLEKQIKPSSSVEKDIEAQATDSEILRIKAAVIPPELEPVLEPSVSAELVVEQQPLPEPGVDTLPDPTRREPPMSPHP
jgi:hypothetical protein